MRETPPSYTDLIKEEFGQDDLYRGFRAGITLFWLIPKLSIEVLWLANYYGYVSGNISRFLYEIDTGYNLVIIDMIFWMIVTAILWFPADLFGDSNP